MAAPSNGAMALKELCDLYLRYQHARVVAGELSRKHYSDQIDSLGKLTSFFGRGRRIRNIATLDLQHYKRKLQSTYGSVHRVNLHLSIMKAMFHWARRNDILENIPNIDAVSRGTNARSRVRQRGLARSQALAAWSLPRCFAARDLTRGSGTGHN